MRLVLMETSGNQRFVFATNKLRESVGASELIYQAGTRFVLDAVREANGPNLWSDDAAQLRRNLTDPGINRPIEQGGAVEVLVATSGKALLAVRDEATAQGIVEAVTSRVLRDAPGVDLRGVVSRDFDFAQDTLAEITAEVHREFEAVRSRRPGPEARFLRLPIVAECATSGRPAATWDSTGPEPAARSAESLAKRRYTDGALNRMQGLARQAKVRFANSIGDLETRFEGLEWLGVIHADGNGLGEIFLGFGQHTDTNRPNRNREYIEKMRRFSLALDVCAEQAVVKALGQLPVAAGRGRGVVALVPLVLGGDDLTVVCDGGAALRFTHSFLQSIEEETARTDVFGGIIPEIANKAIGAPRLSSCAGVAIVKPHFPFASAYELSVELLQEAKVVKRRVTRQGERYPCSALDFHILYDASGADLASIRRRLTTDGGRTRLTAKPYVVTTSNVLEVCDEDARSWVERHSWASLERRALTILAREGSDGLRRLPNSQLHYLRTGLFLGRAEADARLRLIYQRYEGFGLKDLVESLPPPTMFQEDDGAHHTHFLDAMDAAEFLGETA